jgi:hypothetical protein
VIKFITKWWRTFRNQPFLCAQVVAGSDGKIRINVDFNREFIARLDEQYGELPWWKRDQVSNAKVALLLNDIFSGVADPYLPEEPEPVNQEEVDPFGNPDQIPLMAVRGGTENVTRVDIAKAQRYGQPYRTSGNR